ncbi:ATP-binding cassette domain-containing protein [Amycolatopsis acidiphila]|uniref:ATP-binding cassette domain-containing protein n=1 Tax=Amycolatopsis acidiphila TaxID=715473 RepID=A0A558AJN9_9PSEU|nr:ATP-binding cassette domain-containing protein [Amycolatopsis acidiphila]TVT24478.1 ATP-binding cassette domain-containing protein [Amycolatopsis acidiphila]UIJ59311.1 ATP-binding cassette domain-containing protein [Amycolatopsis acidiphila]
MMLRAEIELSRGTFDLAVDFEVPAGTVLAILGPNGSGKSSLLGSLSGLLRPRRAKILLGDRDLHQLPPHDRSVGLLSQDPLLFPHLSVLDNVAFSPRSKGAGRAEARQIARRWLAEVDAAEFERRKPAQLSGGQAQRVAVARALAGEPDLLLLDEPLAALDVDAAPAIRGLLRRVLSANATRATVLVTHDPLDALALADHVLVLTEGRALERGPTREVLAAPRTAFTARIAGLNLVAGTAVDDGLRTDEGRLIAGMLAEDAALGEPAVAVFAPSAVAVYPVEDGRPGSPRNTMAASVTALEPHGPVIRLRTDVGLAADLTPAAVADLRLEPGTPVRLDIKATTVTVYPASLTV